MRSHKKTLDHICHICGRGFKEYWYLTTHLRTHDKSLISSSHQGHFEGNNTCSRRKDEVKSVQHNEVQQQLRLMIERNQRQQSTGEETAKGAVKVDKDISSKIHRDFQKIIASAAKQTFLIENVFKKNELAIKNDQHKNKTCYQGNVSKDSFEKDASLSHVQLASCDRGVLNKAAVFSSYKESMQRRKSKPLKVYYDQTKTHVSVIIII